MQQNTQILFYTQKRSILCCRDSMICSRYFEILKIMLQQERQQRILGLLSSLKNLSTERVMQELDISRETARRDIVELEKLGLLKRVHGGITCLDEVTAEAPLTIRQSQMVKEKRNIARAVLQHLKPGLTIFLDAGSTTSILADELRYFSGLTIITNSLQAVFNLTVANQDNTTAKHEIILLGGKIFQRPQTQGEQVISEIQRYYADIAILSPVGIHPKHGATSFSSEEAEIARAMIKHSKNTFILADHTKVGTVSRINYAKPEEISTLFTDADIDLNTQFKHVVSV